MVCRYVSPTPVKETIGIKTPELKPALLEETLEPRYCSSLASNVSFRKASPYIKSSLLLAASLSDSSNLRLPVIQALNESMTANDTLQLQVSQIIRASEQYVDEISVKYFQGIHRWLPVISRHRFHNCLVDFHNRASADFSVLLLTMCLATTSPDLAVKDIDQETLYLTTKMLFAHASSILPLSTRLIQAGLLITTYEYAQGMNDVAYVSVGNCARMATAIGLAKVKLDRNQIDDALFLKTEEERNLWWAIVICERY